MGTLSVTHWLIIIGVVVILFGAKRMPDAARGLGRSMRIFKSEIQEMHGADGTPAPAAPPSVTTVTGAGEAAANARVAEPAAQRNHSVPSGT